MENAARRITAKFDLTRQLLEKLEEDGEIRAAWTIELDASHTRYALCTCHLFLQAATGGSAKITAQEEFQRVVAAEGFVTELDGLVRRIQAKLEAEQKPKPKRKTTNAPAHNSSLREVQSLIDQYSGQKVDCVAQTVERSVAQLGKSYNICPDCNIEMVINGDTSELECLECGKVRELVGTVFDDAQFYNQEGQKAKSGSFNPNRHYRFWIDRILAREPEEELGDKDDPQNQYGEKLLNTFRNLVEEDSSRILRLLDVRTVRAMLKELGRKFTHLNKNVPLIMKKLTGVGPPQLPEAICQRAEKIFTQAIEIGERIRDPRKPNRNYYPYYIYKIFDAILDKNDKEGRRVLYYIYLQGRDTLDKNDLEWERICEELDEITWEPTDPSKALQYRPD